MPIAPHVAAWGRRWPRQAIGPARGASGVGGPFLSDVFADARQSIQAAFGADLTADPLTWTWYDITTDVQWTPGVQISNIGQRDEATATSGTPATIAFTLKNPLDDYTLENVYGKWWPNVRENTPIRAVLNIGTGDCVRFQGYANGWPPRWDASRNAAFVDVSAAGVYRRLKQGKSKPKSAFERWIRDTADPDDPHPLPVEWWPLEEGYGSDQAASGLGAPHAPMTPFFGSSHPSGAVVTAPRWGSGQLAPWLPSVVSRSADAGLTIIWAPASMPLFDEQWVVEILYNSGTDAGDSTIDINPSYLGRAFSGASGWPQLIFSPTNAAIQVTMNAEPEVTTSTSMFDNNVHHIRWVAFQFGANVSWYVQLDGADMINSGTTSGAMTLQPIVTIALVADAQTGGGFAQGHLTIWYDPVTPASDAALGYAGETTVDRMRRICRQEGVSLDVVGDSDTLMGPQPTDTFLNLVDDCRKAEDAPILDGLGPGLTMICRTSAYSLPATMTLDAALGQFDPPVPKHDDAGRCNRFTARQRYTNAESTVELTTGDMATDVIGEYDSSDTINLYSAADLDDYAGWRVATSTPFGLRYPALTLQLEKPAIAVAQAQDWLDLKPFQRVDMINMQDGRPTRRNLVRGWSERWNSKVWVASLVLSSYDPWAVTVVAAELGDTGEFVGWWDTDGTVVAAPVAVGASSVSVTVTSGPLWSTAADDVPFQVRVSGIDITVTAVGAAVGSAQTFTVDPATVTKPLQVNDRVVVTRGVVVGR